MASTLPSGERVFLDEDGSAYTEDGRKLTDDEFVQVDWKEGSPSWDDFTQNRDDLRQAQERQAEMQRHSKRLEEIEHELKDTDNPPSKDKLNELVDEMGQIERSLDLSKQSATSLETNNTTPVIVPELNF